MLKRICIIGASIFLLAACKTSPSTSTEQQPETSPDAGFTFETREVLLQSGTCDTEGAPCAQVNISLPVIQGGPEGARHAMNGYLSSQVAALLAGYIDEPPQSGDLDTLAKAFIHSFELFRAEFPDANHQWSFEGKGEVVYESPEVVSLMVESYAYTGGAHPNGSSYYLSFDAQSGKELALEDLVSDKQKFLELAEAAFRREKSMEPGDTYSEGGFTFENEVFSLNNNLALVEEGIVLFYNPYEIAAYAAGPTELLITRAELGELLK